MAFKIKNVTGSSEAKEPLLCCTLSPEIECIFCDKVMCAGCGKKWSAARHFVLDLCRKRFTEKEIAAAAECFKVRKGKQVQGLGECKVCITRRSLNSDRYYIDSDIEEGQF